MPDYPSEARDDTRPEVLLVAKLAIGAKGDVVRVDFENESWRNRLFERAARSALLRWRFPEGSGERSYRTEVSFKSPTAGPAAAAPQATAPTRPALLPGEQASLKPLSRVMPDFPPEGREAVTLQARLAINPKGEVTRVDFDNASLRTRPFERAARTALLQWRFPEGSGDRLFRTEVAFKPE